MVFLNPNVCFCINLILIKKIDHTSRTPWAPPAAASAPRVTRARRATLPIDEISENHLLKVNKSSIKTPKDQCVLARRAPAWGSPAIIGENTNPCNYRTHIYRTTSITQPLSTLNPATVTPGYRTPPAPHLPYHFDHLGEGLVVGRMRLVRAVAHAHQRDRRADLEMKMIIIFI